MTYHKAGLTMTLAAIVVGGGAQDTLAAAKYEIDPAHSSVIFKVKHHDISYVYGRFNEVSGVIRVDILRTPSDFEFNVEVAGKSVDTNDKGRDKDLKGADYLNVRKHATITFEGQTVKRLEDNKFEVAGKLGLLGLKKDLTVVFELGGVTRVSRGEFRIGGESTFTIKRSEHGMGEVAPEFADEVTVIVNIEAKCELSPAG